MPMIELSVYALHALLPRSAIRRGRCCYTDVPITTRRSLKYMAFTVVLPSVFRNAFMRLAVFPFGESRPSPCWQSAVVVHVVDFQQREVR